MGKLMSELLHDGFIDEIPLPLYELLAKRNWKSENIGASQLRFYFWLAKEILELQDFGASAPQV